MTPQTYSTLKVTVGDLCCSMYAELVEEFLHVGGEWGLEFHSFFGDGVGEFEFPGVEGASGEEGFFGGGFSVFDLPWVSDLSAVHVVGDDGVFDVRQVDANLVGASGFEVQFDQ